MMEFLLQKLSAILQKAADPWVLIGFIGQFTFGCRFIIQWIVTEIKRKSVIPVSFWYLSIIGSLISLSYALHIEDPVFTLGMSFNSIIYIRNLYFIYKRKKKKEIPLTATQMIRGDISQ